MNFSICTVLVILIVSFFDDGQAIVNGSIDHPDVESLPSSPEYQYMTTPQPPTSISDVLEEILEEVEEENAQKQHQLLVETNTNVLDRGPNEIHIDPKDYQYEVLPTIHHRFDKDFIYPTSTEHVRGGSDFDAFDDLLTLPPKYLKAELENMDENKLLQFLGKVARNLSSSALENETVLMKLCMDFMHNNETCAHLYRLGKDEQYFTLTWEITYRMFLFRPYGVFVFIIWTVILCVLNFIILFLCTFLKPLRSFLLTKIVSDLRRRYYFTSDSSEMRIIDQSKK